MKKIITAAIALAFVATAFSACTKDVQEPEATTNTTTSEVVTEESSTTSTTTATETTTSTTESKKIEVDSMETLLNLITKFQSGTAGSSLKVMSLSIRFLNFTESLDESKGALKDANAFLSSLSSEELDSFNQNLAEIDYVARNIINDPTGSIHSRIEQCEEPYNENGYSLEKYEAIYDFIADWTNE